MLSKLLDIPNHFSFRVKSADCGPKRTTEKSGIRNKKQTGDKTVQSRKQMQL